MGVNIPERKALAKERYEQKLAQLKDPDKIKKLNKEYRLLRTVLHQLTRYSRKHVSENTGVHPTTIYDWARRKFPRSMRLTPSRKNEINIEKLESSTSFLYLLGMYQSRVKRIDPRRIIMKSKEKWLEERVFDHILAVFGDNHSKNAMYESKELMAYIKDITDDNDSLPERLLKERDGISQRNLEGLYLGGVFDSKASITYHKRKMKTLDVVRIKPVIFLRITNETLQKKIQTLLKKHGITASQSYSKRDKKNQLCINEAASVKKVLKYLLPSPKYDKLSELVIIASGHDFLGRETKKILAEKKKKEKIKNKANIDSSTPLRSSRLPLRGARVFLR